MTTDAIEAAAKALNRVIYGAKAEIRWAQSSEVREARRKEATAAIVAYQSSVATSATN
jgi:hypothetical protein